VPKKIDLKFSFDFFIVFFTLGYFISFKGIGPFIMFRFRFLQLAGKKYIHMDDIGLIHKSVVVALYFLYDMTFNPKLKKRESDRERESDGERIRVFTYRTFILLCKDRIYNSIALCNIV
jgi:hypothetical protein